jgi:hypothetical protein
LQSGIRLAQENKCQINRDQRRVKILIVSG